MLSICNQILEVNKTRCSDSFKAIIGYKMADHKLNEEISELETAYKNRVIETTSNKCIEIWK